MVVRRYYLRFIPVRYAAAAGSPMSRKKFIEQQFWVDVGYAIVWEVSSIGFRGYITQALIEVSKLEGVY